MTYPKTVYLWREELQHHFPHLNRALVWGLAVWSYGVIYTRSSSLTQLSLFLCAQLGRKPNTLRQFLREWYSEKEHKRGRQRQEVDVESCFAPLLSWILSYWRGPHLALAMDATTLGTRFVVLCISVVYRGSAIPVAWHILRANEKGAWEPHWLRLLSVLQPAIPTTLCVIVLADRGLYASWLFHHIVNLGWHPYLRVNDSGVFRRENEQQDHRMTFWVKQVQGCGAVSGTAFRTSPLKCTLAIYYEKGCAEAWIVVTDLAPAACEGCWYGLRAWIEHSFKFTKKEGWQWQRTRMEDPERATRIWLAMAVATFWILVIGTQAEEEEYKTSPALRHKPRAVSLFRKGLARFWDRLRCNGGGRQIIHCWEKARLIPELWPKPGQNYQKWQNTINLPQFQNTYT